MSMNSPYKVIVKKPSAALKKKTRPGRRHYLVIGPDGEEVLRWWSGNGNEADSDCDRLNAAYAKGLAAQSAEIERTKLAIEAMGDGRLRVMPSPATYDGDKTECWQFKLAGEEHIASGRYDTAAAAAEAGVDAMETNRAAKLNAQEAGQ